MDRSLLAWGAVILFIVTGVLLLVSDTVSLRTALALTDFALAAFVAAGARWITP
jgi:hypothetical protein